MSAIKTAYSFQTSILKRIKHTEPQPRRGAAARSPPPPTEHPKNEIKKNTVMQTRWYQKQYVIWPAAEISQSADD